MSSYRQPIRVLHLLPTFEDRGAQRIALWIAGDLDRRCFVPFAASLRPEGQAAARFEARSVSTTTFGANERLLVDPRVVARLVTFLRTQRIDVVHTHGVRDGIYGRVSGRIAGCPVIVSSIHNKWGSSMHHLIDGATMRLADLVLPFSQTTATFARRQLAVPAAKMRVIYFGIETERFAGVPSELREQRRRALGVSTGEFLIGSAAALTDQKGFDYLVEAAPYVLAAHPRCTFVIAGDGQRRATLEAQVRRRGISDRFQFVGAIEDVPEFLASLDMFVLPSRWEGLPIAAVEAMASGRPVLLTRVDGNAELVTDNETGYLVEPNSSTALARRIAEVVTTVAEVRQTVARRGQRLALERFTRRRMVSEFSDIYKALVEAKGWHRQDASSSAT